MKVTAKEVFNIPNILCYVRFLLIPCFVVSYLRAENSRDYYIAASFLLIAGITDLLDGYIARKFNQVTELGKAIDPIADKLTQTAILLCTMFRVKGMFLLVILFAVKECTMGICGFLLLKRNKKLDGAMWFGKVSTAVFYVTMLILIAFPTMKVVWVNLLMIITGAFLALSFLLYIPVYARMFRES
ncbi:CDP-alcohol phosphatidyltransferase family protein [Lachnoclostridium phytofermentans]|jgi:cardiolipin synthase|uniref:CDP-alcohol phosphatidyltransferase family protein n=1 Tax=Lachnoclostridium phytofermentans TaxID=66219 RepID=UPI0004985254|nr:CDP-alcohol phosphatidyltransferase family protein [Lachnoclostridium phytofermentans]